MPAQMNVDPELLADSSEQAHAVSQAVVADHDHAHAAICAALPGWVGLSRAALVDTAARWAVSTVATAARVADHAHALGLSGLTFAAMDTRHAACFATVRPTAQAP